MSLWEAADLSAWIENGLPEGAQGYLSEVRLAEVRRYSGRTKRCRSAGAELLLRVMLAETGIRSPRDWTWETEANGKPWIAELPGVCFNLSHSGHYAACAVGAKPLGADIQLIGPRRNAVIRRCFLPEEQERIAYSEDPDGCFAAVWAVKEAYLKWTGEGIRRRMDTFRTDFDRERIVDIRTGREVPFRETFVRGKAVFAVCGEELPEKEPRICSAEELWERAKLCRTGEAGQRR